jgi:hypothetical protein
MMSRDFDFFPTYDPLVKDQVYLSNIWSDFMATFVESLREYLSSTGVFIPRLTLAQRDAITTPQEGQMIYVTDANTPALPRTAELQIYQVIAGVAGWTVIV